ncbi:DUF6538 domain-containing protein [Ectothiorhodospira variabilis]|uniref:DUF6538 domain-containing protein n=1 Tax=Ectothiorhodospira variabilis TaxID=505694 RepID=UPI001EFB537E|nr:DUF6538 domain-containing protein [Ectothiorhodospira variabilis]MCG5494519.1 tyrosine-type recombinase/integrase [Ectothiorhodospira variabilis]MCG5503110.1 tyrosine-type recombinase/integrase [Ectothiorhodospira variabilis]MCG5506131.1 tyrosine-type recombinase/integrase [Ectothiorhodospira variabilis]
MPFTMAHPQKHPKTGMYWARKVVPAHLRPIVGKRELKLTLQTKCPREARKRFPQVLTQFEAMLKAAEHALTLGADDLQSFAAGYYQTRLKQILEEARRNHWSLSDHEAMQYSLSLVPDKGWNEEEQHQAVVDWGLPRAKALVESSGLTQGNRFTIPQPFMEALAETLYQMEQKAFKAAEREQHYPHLPPSEDLPKAAPVRPLEARSFEALWISYSKANAHLSPKTLEDWGRMWSHFGQWAGETAPDQITPQILLRYAESVRDGAGLSGRPLSAKRVNEGYLAAISTVFRWASKPERGLLQTNPAEAVKLPVPRSEQGPRRRGYTREEAGRILQAARSETKRAYVRWTPWLLAFTGARVSEILNARVEDIGETQGIPYLWIRETEDTRLKNTWSNRCVPLHPALIEEGFLDYVSSLPGDDFLFPGDWADKHGDRTKTPANRLRDWINKALPEMKGQGLAPNHSFRHWLIGELREAGVDGDIQRQLTGHKSGADVHSRYGPADIPRLHRAIIKVVSPV